MPLLDHFHPPLSERRSWESFHSRWASAIAAWLEQGRLPPGHFAEVQMHVGQRIEVDVGTFRGNGNGVPGSSAASGGTGVATATWAPPTAAMIMPGVFPDEIEVRIFNKEAGPTLVAAIEIVSPQNKDRGDAQLAFTARCISYLSAGVGLVIVDLVTVRLANMHNALVELMGLSSSFLLAEDVTLYVVAYRPVKSDDAAEIHVWPHVLAIGSALPTVPLALRGATIIPLDLEATYAELCRLTRLS